MSKQRTYDNKLSRYNPCDSTTDHKVAMHGTLDGDGNDTNGIRDGNMEVVYWFGGEAQDGINYLAGVLSSGDGASKTRAAHILGEMGFEMGRALGISKILKKYFDREESASLRGRLMDAMVISQGSLFLV